MKREFSIKEFFQFKNFLLFLILKDLKVRYRGTVAGVLWSVIQPLIIVFFFLVVFGRIWGEGNMTNYTLSTLVGILCFHFFISVFGDTPAMLIGQKHLLSKIYFPKYIPALARNLFFFVDYIVVLTLIIIFILVTNQQIHFNTVYFPLVILHTFLVTLGISLCLSVLLTLVRDLKFFVQFISRLLIILSPIGFRSEALGEYAWAVNVNPLSGMIDLHRWSLLGDPFGLDSFLISCTWGLIGFFLSYYLFIYRDELITERL